MTDNNTIYTLSIAGHDPSSGAGLTADIKTFEQCGVYGFSVVSAITVQNDSDFKEVVWTDISLLKKQIDVLFDIYTIEFVKIGLVESMSVLQELIQYLKLRNSDIKIIWDPILKSSSGFNFHEIRAEEISSLLDDIYLITPNQPEFETLGLSDEYFYRCNCLLKGGHHEKPGTDILFVKEARCVLEGKSFNGLSKHGTGCVLSSAISAYLALGYSLEEACRKGKYYVERFILSAKSNLGWHKSVNEDIKK